MNKRIFLGALCSFVLSAGVAHAVIMQNITGASWPTSGTATTGSTGFNTVTGTWTHVGSADVPLGSVATGYLELASGAVGTFRVDDATAPFTTGEDHWVKFFISPSRDLTKPAPLDSGVVDILTIMDVIDGGGNKLRLWTYTRNTPTTVGTPGLNLLPLEFTAGASTYVSLDGMGGTDSPAVVPYDAWTEIVIHVRVHATDGRFGVYVNGVLVSEVTAFDSTNVQITTADIKSDWSIQLGNIAGLKFRVAGPIQSWNGTDIPVRPRYDLEPSNSYQTKMFLHHATDTVYTQGRMFTYGGTATMTPTKYTTAAPNPNRRRIVISGTSGQTANIMTIDALGVLPYNEDGWATVFFTDFYLPGTGTTCDFILRNTANTADVVRLTYDGTDLKQGATVLKAGLTKTSRWKLAVHVNQNGTATFSLMDETSSPLTTQTYFSGPLDNWTPQDIGTAGFAAVYGNSTFELGAISVHRWLEVGMLDSLSTGGISGLTPEAQGPAFVSAQFSQVADSDGIPNVWRLRNDWVARGFGRRNLAAQIGRGGLNRADWNTHVASGMTYARGVIVWNIDGGSINDVGSGTANQAAVDAKLVYMATNYDATIASVLASGANRMIVTTMIRRERGSFNTFDLLIIDGFNAIVRARAASNPTKLFLADVAGDIRPHRPLFWDSGDDVHMGAVGNYRIAKRMIADLLPAATLARPSAGSRPVVSR